MWSRRATSVTRIVAGRAGGRRITVPPGASTRPTSDRAREALFSALEALRGAWEGARVLDLFAGSGALGLEALSRGAVHTLLVDSDARAAATIRDNVAALGLDGAVVRCDRVERVVGAPAEAPYDVVFLDPPYREPVERVVAVVTALTEGWLAPDAAVVVERSSRDPDFPWPDGLETARERSYGEAKVSIALWYGRPS